MKLHFNPNQQFQHKAINTTDKDIQYYVYVREKIEKGLEDQKTSRVLSQDEVEKRLAKYL